MVMVRQILQPLSTASAVRSRLIFNWQSNSNSSKIKRAGGHLKPSKCQFMIKEVEYLGHQISEKGLQLTEEKTKTLKDAPIPKNIFQLKSSLGLLNYYTKFLPNMSTKMAPLYHLSPEEGSLALESRTGEGFSPGLGTSVLTH